MPPCVKHRRQAGSGRSLEQQRISSSFSYREFTEAGGLMSYGANVSDLFRRTAGLVDKILKGTKPAEIPVEMPTKFELAINLKTAKALSLEIPSALLIVWVTKIAAPARGRSCAGFRMPAMLEGATTRWPASESRQGTNPRAMVGGGAATLVMGIWVRWKECAKERNASGRER